MDIDFDAALLRLKGVLKVRTDKEVAARIGMSATALNERKKRNSFPADKVRALAAKELFDSDYVLTGITQGATARLAALQHTIETASAAGLSVEQVRAAAGAATGPSAQRIQALAEMIKGLRVSEFDAVFALTATIVQLRRALETAPTKSSPKKRT